MKTYLDRYPCFLRQALALYPQLRALLAEADDPLEVAVRLSIAGNIIDLGPDRQYDLWDEVKPVLAQSFAIDDRAAFRGALSSAGQVLYLADNAGETVFGRLLIEALDAPVVYAVKGGPILNDATREDALAANDQTHPIPQNYYLTHQKLGTWQSARWRERIQHVLTDEETRLAYD